MGRRSCQPSNRPARGRVGPALAAVLLAFAVLGCRSTPIAQQSAAGDAVQVQALLDQGASPDGKDHKSRRALELAVHFQHADVVRVLVKGGADVESPTSRGIPPLHYAAMRGNADIVRLLIEGGAHFDVEDRQGYTPLGRAVASRNWEAAAVLSFAGAELMTKQDHAGADRQLLRAVLKRQWPTAAQLVRYGANTEMQHRGKSMRELAEAGADPEMMEALAGSAPAPAAAPQAVAAAETPRTPFPSGTPAFAATSPDQPPPPAGVDFGHYHALVIGNDDYEYMPKLRTAVNDATAVAELLRSGYDYEVTQLDNASRADILRALTDYRRTLGPDDNLLIYYAGHGWLDPDADRGYWLPVDARVDDVVNWIDNGSITSAVRAMQAKHVLVVADSCYSGELTRGVQIVSRTPDYIQRLASRRARVVLTSGGLEPVRDSGGKNQHSVFASAFLDVLRENRGVLEGQELFTRLRRPVAVNSDQVPRYSDIRMAGHDGGDFLFVRRR